MVVSGHTVEKFQLVAENTQTMGCLGLYTLITDVLCRQKLKQRKLDKKRVLRAISRDEQ